MLDVPAVVGLLQQLPVLGACRVCSMGWLRAVLIIGTTLL